MGLRENGVRSGGPAGLVQKPFISKQRVRIRMKVSSRWSFKAVRPRTIRNGREARKTLAVKARVAPIVPDSGRT